ncbi:MULTISPECIES: FCD domain-containing protein [Arthrobacter]|uniref:FCD domain-containing protein n=2 Tax=Arthrobacter TaxID=1663 RepID=A0ABU9KP41_9MICC|nr:FCD domain-containing protein [Arthrobacter sp. YJM1]MDP5227639.1 FCD domain-containing protein [Arthrobacter sp. YJM1]
MTEPRKPSGMKSIARRTLVEEATEQLLAQITAGTWQIGDRLPTAIELADELGVSRSPIREATRALVHAGLLESRQGDGTYVIAVNEASGVLARRGQQANGQEVIDVRKGLDVAAARAAALARTTEDLDELEDILARRRVAAAQAAEEEFVSLDLDFHLGVAKAAHNGILHDIYYGLLGAIRTSMEVRTYLGPDHLAHDHEDLLDAIRDRDPGLAATIATGIINEQDELVRKHPS